MSGRQPAFSAFPAARREAPLAAAGCPELAEGQHAAANQHGDTGSGLCLQRPLAVSPFHGGPPPCEDLNGRSLRRPDQRARPSGAVAQRGSKRVRERYDRARRRGRREQNSPLCDTRRGPRSRGGAACGRQPLAHNGGFVSCAGSAPVGQRARGVPGGAPSSSRSAAWRAPCIGARYRPAGVCGGGLRATTAAVGASNTTAATFYCPGATLSADPNRPRPCRGARKGHLFVTEEVAFVKCESTSPLPYFLGTTLFGAGDGLRFQNSSALHCSEVFHPTAIVLSVCIL
jgi:hypothetical protein